MSQSINQSLSQVMNQSTSQTKNQSKNQTKNQTKEQSTNQSTNQSRNQSRNQSTNQQTVAPAESEIKQRLRTWVQELANAKGIEISDRTPIIEQRIITSVQVMDLILFIERLKNEPLEIDSLKPGAFRDVETIYANFFQGERDEHR